MTPPDRSRSMGLVLTLIGGCLVMAVLLFVVVRSTLLTAYEEEVAPAQAQAQLEFVASQIALHTEQHGSPPSSLADLVPDHLAGPPIDPWGRSVLYQVDEAGKWTLRSLGGDGKEGGVGAAADLVHESP